MIYKVFSHHYAPKDSHTAIQFFVKAQDERELYELIKKEMEFPHSVYSDKGVSDNIKTIVKYKNLPDIVDWCF